MKRKRPKSDSALSSEEDALWQYVAKSVTPIRAKSHVRKRGSTVVADEAAASPPVPQRQPARAKPTLKEKPRSAALAPIPAKPTPALADFDARKSRRLSRGRDGIDARIDLHGLRHDEARHRLRGFLRDAVARGHKTVLVITGKGRDGDHADRPFVEMLDRAPRGVLRRSLPGWLAEPDIRALVVSFTEAAQRHGGDGAFYVQLRRQRST